MGASLALPKPGETQTLFVLIWLERVLGVKGRPLLGLRAVKLDLALAEIGFDAVELAQKIVPEYAAELAVSEGLEAERLLLRDGVLL